jgi:hypothetical protein
LPDVIVIASVPSEIALTGLVDHFPPSVEDQDLKVLIIYKKSKKLE